MTFTQLSDKGQITLPADARRTLGLKPKSRVEVEVRGNEIIIRPVKSIREVRGIFHGQAKKKAADWETVRSKTEEAIAREVVDEDRR